MYKWICEKFSYRFDGLSKTLLFYFSYFNFEYFLFSLHPFLWLISKLYINCYPLTKIWGLEIFDSETRVLKIFLKICTETGFHCLFSLNEKIIAMCYLMIHIECVAVICFNEIWSSLKRSFWNNRPSKTVTF